MMPFLEGKIQLLVCTSTLAWGVNFPAHLVVIKGTEFFDGKLGRYVDYAITDVLHMMGRAGRPQFDKEGVAYMFFPCVISSLALFKTCMSMFSAEMTVLCK